MNKGIIFALGAVVGGALGSVATWYGLRTKFEQIANAEIEVVRETYKKKYENIEKEPSQNASVTHQEPRRAILGVEDDEEVTDSTKMAQNANKRSREHTDYSKISKEKLEEIDEEDEDWEDEDDSGVEMVPGEYNNKKEMAPYVITPDEFSISLNEKIYVMLYADGVLADNDGIIIDSEEFFGDLVIENCFDVNSPEPDLAFIRDPRLKLDYEISKGLLTYDEMYDR